MFNLSAGYQKLCALGPLIKVRPPINVCEGQHIKINKGLVLNKDVLEGKFFQKIERPGLQVNVQEGQS